MKKTMDQYRACWAWKQTKETQEAASQSEFEDYVKLAEGTPATILMCGLGQTVALYLAKKKGPNDHLLRNLASWICRNGGRDNPDQKGKRGKQGADLRDEIISQDTDRDRYHELTDETLEYLVWIKRFAKAI